MTVEVTADEPAVPSLVVERIGGGVNPYEAAAGFDVSLQIDLGGPFEKLASRVKKDDGPIVAEGVLGQKPDVLRRVDSEAVFRSELEDGGLAGGNRPVTKASRFGEHEHSGRSAHAAGGGEGQGGQ
jgi:hypothetical protein